MTPEKVRDLTAGQDPSRSTGAEQGLLIISDRRNALLASEVVERMVKSAWPLGPKEGPLNMRMPIVPENDRIRSPSPPVQGGWLKKIRRPTIKNAGDDLFWSGYMSRNK